MIREYINIDAKGESAYRPGACFTALIYCSAHLIENKQVQNHN